MTKITYEATQSTPGLLVRQDGEVIGHVSANSDVNEQFPVPFFHLLVEDGQVGIAEFNTPEEAAESLAKGGYER